MGPPKPWTNPAAHGTKHCQRYTPLPGVRNVNELVVWSLLSEQGALLHGFLALSEMPWSGTDRPNCGTANTCEAEFGSIATVDLPLSVYPPPTVPCAWPKNAFRRPVAESNW